MSEYWWWANEEQDGLLAVMTENVRLRLRLWAQRAISILVRRRRRVHNALIQGINTGGEHDRQALLRRLQFVNPRRALFLTS